MPPKRNQPKRSKPKRNQRPRKPRGTVYKSSKGLVAPRAYNVEVVQRNLLPQLTNFSDNAATTTLPKNTSIHMPCMFNANDSDVVPAVHGSWICPKWLTSKFRISFDKIVPDHADSAKGFNLWMIQGVVKTTGYKSGADTSNYTNWTADILTVVGKELVDSDFDSDYLEYTRANRNIKVVKKQLIKPKRDQSIRKAIMSATGGEAYTAPPPVCLSVNHELPNFKQRVVEGAVGVSQTPQMNNSYIPFVAFMCDELTRNTGSITIEQSSRFYFTDM